MLKILMHVYICIAVPNKNINRKYLDLKSLRVDTLKGTVLLV